jgi:hypothetical protein
VVAGTQAPRNRSEVEMSQTRISSITRALPELANVTQLWMVVALLLASPFLSASSIPTVTGSYTLLQHTTRGPQAQIRMRIHLVNSGASDLFIQRMTVSNLSHPDRGSARPCAVTVRAHSSLETTQEFTIPRSEYQLWRRGMKPRFILQVGSATSKAPAKNLAVVLENRIPTQEAK